MFEIKWQFITNSSIKDFLKCLGFYDKVSLTILTEVGKLVTSLRVYNYKRKKNLIGIWCFFSHGYNHSSSPLEIIMHFGALIWYSC